MTDACGSVRGAVGMRRSFDRFTAATSRVCASPMAFVLAFSSIVLWAGAGPFFGYSAAWQMVINTGTTIITFLLAFVILASNARSEAALQAKLDELIRASDGARNSLIALEEQAADDIAAEAAAVRQEAVTPGGLSSH